MITPLSNHLVVRRNISYGGVSSGGIILPQSTHDDNNVGGPKEVLVISVGPGKLNRKGVRIPIECEPGDRCIIHSYTTGPQPLPDGTLLITDDQILAVIPKQP